MKLQISENIWEEVKTCKLDTGSSQVQVLLLTDKILSLADHIKANHKDNSAKRRLTSMVGHRKRLMNYLKRKNMAMFEKINAILKA